MSRPRPHTLALGALALLLAAAPFVPRGDDDEGALRPSGDATGRQRAALATADTAPLGTVTPDLRAEIDRVLAAGGHAGRVAVSAAPAQLASALVRCADFEGQRYCLHTGWTEKSPAQVRAEVAQAARAAAERRAPAVTTGDLDQVALLRRFGRMSPTARLHAERAELTDAARSVAKVWLLRHEIEGVRIPASVLAAHPEMRAGTSASKTTAAARAKHKQGHEYPQRDRILNPDHVSEQHQTYWCGPTTMQMVAWGWKGTARNQKMWARRLGTTSSGTAITDMVRVTNHYTGWDDADHAGAYIVLDIGDYSFYKWNLLIMRHVTDYKAPVILHPVLKKKFYPYLDDDASGHFQVGRGYKKRGSKPNLLGYFEPWNQQRFDPSEPYIDRVQWRQAYKSYRANEAHFQHNIGV